MTLGQLVRLSRPPTLAASVVPVAVGTAAGALAAPPSWPWTLDMALVAILLQAGTNMLNEYADFRRGVDDVGSVGIAGVLVRGELTPQEVRSAAVTTFLVALALGLGLAWARGPLLLALGLASIAVAVAYNLGPLPLSQTPWGEAVVFCVMGPLETAVSEVAAVGYVTWAGLAASLPVGALVAGILLANNVRDLEPDRARGRTTLPMVLGVQASLVLFTGLAATALAFPAAAYLAGWLPASSMLAALAAPEAATVVQALARGTGLSRAVPLAARLELTVGLLLALGLAWAAVR